MASERFPGQTWLIRRWRSERGIRALRPALMGIAIFAALLLLVLVFVPFSISLFLGVIGVAFFVFFGAGIFLVWVCTRTPSTEALAKRADRVLGLPDDLLALGEMNADASPSAWEVENRRLVSARLEALKPREAWRVVVPVSTRWAAGVAGVLLVALIWIGAIKWSAEGERLATLDAARDERLEVAAKILDDWEEFVNETPDEVLKEMVSKALKLREALAERDPMAAMLEMNRIEKQMDSLEEQIANDSIAGEAKAMAEALESFEGMGAMSAALRNQDFETAAEEAQKVSEEIAAKPTGQNALQREAAVSEMLADQAAKAGSRGNDALEEALKELSELARQAKSGSVPRENLGKPVKQLANEFSKQAARQNQGRMVSLSKQQLEELRRRLREGREGMGDMPSLAQGTQPGGDQPGGDQPGGKQAGTGSSKPEGVATELTDPGRTESLTGVIGEGESEVTTVSSASGSGTAAGSAQGVEFADYAELSRRAVADENLPLAHRRIIRTYFERIRPIAESKNP